MTLNPDHDIKRNNKIADYLKLIGVAELPARTSPFDPGYDPVTVESHIQQSGHLMSVLKISMACWLRLSTAGAGFLALMAGHSSRKRLGQSREEYQGAQRGASPRRSLAPDRMAV